MDIVSKMRDEIIRRSNDFESKTKGTKDEYNIYLEHIRYVYDYVIRISKDYDVDLEVLEISALLHDISMTDSSLDRANHNVYGSRIAEELLRENGYPEDKIEFVKKCILNHSSSRVAYRTTLEEEILVTADGLSHFDSISSLYSFFHNVKGYDEIDSLNCVKDKLTRDYNEIKDEFKYLVKDKYDKVMNCSSIEDII